MWTAASWPEETSKLMPERIISEAISLSGVFSDQQIGVADDAQAAQQHGADGNQGREQAGHGDRDADGIVEEGQHKVLADLAGDAAGEIQELGDLGGFGPHQGGVGHFLSRLPPAKTASDRSAWPMPGRR